MWCPFYFADFRMCECGIVTPVNVYYVFVWLASVLLKQYVDCHWSSLSEEKFKPPEVSPNVS